jgi:Helix-turn-helix domain
MILLVPRGGHIKAIEFNDLSLGGTIKYPIAFQGFLAPLSHCIFEVRNQRPSSGSSASIPLALRTNPESCKPLTSVSALLYSLRTAPAAQVFLLLVRASDLAVAEEWPRRPNADERSHRAHWAPERIMSAKNSRRSIEKRGYTATEACWYLGIGKTKLHQLLANGVLPRRWIDSRLVFLKDDLDRLLENTSAETEVGDGR